MAQEFLDVWQGHTCAQHLHRTGVPKLMGVDPFGNLGAIHSRKCRVLVQQVGVLRQQDGPKSHGDKNASRK